MPPSPFPLEISYAIFFLSVFIAIYGYFSIANEHSEKLKKNAYENTCMSAFTTKEYLLMPYVGVGVKLLNIKMAA
jgi:hypothetical protein